METISLIMIGYVCPIAIALLAIFLIAGIVLKVMSKKSSSPEKLKKISKACFIAAIVAFVIVVLSLLTLLLTPNDGGDYMEDLKALNS